MTTSAYGLLLGRNTSEVPLFLAVDDDGDDDLGENGTGDPAHEFSDAETSQHHDVVLAPVTDAPSGRRAPAAASTATAAAAAAATDRLTDALFAARPASATLRPATGAWEAQRLPDAWPVTDGAEDGDGGGDGDGNEDVSEDFFYGLDRMVPWVD